MADFTFATLRLGKTSVEEIKRINSKTGGASTEPFPISVVCTQIPTDLDAGVIVFIWLGSDNSKGMATEWKQGFKAIGRVTSVARGEKYNDESTTEVEVFYVFPNAINRLDILRDAAADYYRCSSMPIIGLDDHSNQTIRMLESGELSDTNAFFSALDCVYGNFSKELLEIEPRFAPMFRSVTEEEPVVEQIRPIRFATGLTSDLPRNRILFGAPGTGKSFTLNHEKDALLADGGEYECVTFHPDYSYANFVGTYKPVPCKDSDGKDAITYSYVPGPFMRTYVKALQNSRTGAPKPFLLVIEEINRANVAAVFGDVFQLLDRGDDEVSEYPIQASEDIKKYLTGELGGNPDDYSEIRIPDNMFIWATMNSADQGVFPMDTAFKRRWDFTYLGIDDSEAGIVGKKVVLGQGEYRRVVEWNALRKAINSELLTYKVNEDKLMGPYFISKKNLPEGNTIDPAVFTRIFKNKVLMYLFDDAAKQKRPSLFAGCKDENKNLYSQICREFDTKGVFIFCTKISDCFLPEDDGE